MDSHPAVQEYNSWQDATAAHPSGGGNRTPLSTTV